MKIFLLLIVCVFSLVSAKAQTYYNGKWYYNYNGTWYEVQAPNTRYDTKQPPMTSGIHGYYFKPGFYGPTGVWYPGVWLAY